MSEPDETVVAAHAHDPACELCEAAPLTPWFHEDEHCWIAECEACQTPMVVWRAHGIDPSDEVTTHMLAMLDTVAAVHFDAFWIDDNRRSIPGHWHVHARPRGGFYG